MDSGSENFLTFNSKNQYDRESMKYGKLRITPQEPICKNEFLVGAYSRGGLIRGGLISNLAR